MIELIEQVNAGKLDPIPLCEVHGPRTGGALLPLFGHLSEALAYCKLYRMPQHLVLYKLEGTRL
jgi:hypothetical protein